MTDAIPPRLLSRTRSPGYFSTRTLFAGCLLGFGLAIHPLVAAPTPAKKTSPPLVEEDTHPDKKSAKQSSPPKPVLTEPERRRLYLRNHPGEVYLAPRTQARGQERFEKFPLRLVVLEYESWQGHRGWDAFFLFQYRNYPNYRMFQGLPLFRHYTRKDVPEYTKSWFLPLYYYRSAPEERNWVTPLYLDFKTERTSPIRTDAGHQSRTRFRYLFPLFFWGQNYYKNTSLYTPPGPARPSPEATPTEPPPTLEKTSQARTSYHGLLPLWYYEKYHYREKVPGSPVERRETSLVNPLFWYYKDWESSGEESRSQGYPLLPLLYYEDYSQNGPPGKKGTTSYYRHFLTVAYAESREGQLRQWGLYPLFEWQRLPGARARPLGQKNPKLDRRQFQALSLFYWAEDPTRGYNSFISPLYSHVSRRAVGAKTGQLARQVDQTLMPFYYSRRDQLVWSQNDESGRQLRESTTWVSLLPIWLPNIPLYYHHREGYQSTRNILGLYHTSGDIRDPTRINLHPLFYYHPGQMFLFLPFYGDIQTAPGPAGKDAGSRYRFSPVHYFADHPEEHTRWFLPWYHHYHRDLKKGEEVILFPVYYNWTRAEEKGTIFFPFTFDYEDQDSEIDLNLLGFYRKNTWVPSVKTGISWKGHRLYHFDSDFSWLYNMFSVSTRTTVWRDQSGWQWSWQKEETKQLRPLESPAPPGIRSKKSFDRDDTYNFFGWQALFGLWAWESGDSMRHLRVLPFSWLSWEESSDYRVTVIPPIFVHYRNRPLLPAEKEGAVPGIHRQGPLTEYLVVFPFYGHQKQDESWFRFILPWWDSWDQKTRVREYAPLWPFIHHQTSPAGSRTRALPFYYGFKENDRSLETWTFLYWSWGRRADGPSESAKTAKGGSLAGSEMGSGMEEAAGNRAVKTSGKWQTDGRGLYPLFHWQRNEGLWVFPTFFYFPGGESTHWNRAGGFVERHKRPASWHLFPLISSWSSRGYDYFWLAGYYSVTAEEKATGARQAAYRTLAFLWERRNDPDGGAMDALLFRSFYYNRTPREGSLWLGWRLLGGYYQGQRDRNWNLLNFYYGDNRNQPGSFHGLLPLYHWSGWKSQSTLILPPLLSWWQREERQSSFELLATTIRWKYGQAKDPAYSWAVLWRLIAGGHYSLPVNRPGTPVVRESSFNLLNFYFSDRRSTGRSGLHAGTRSFLPVYHYNFSDYSQTREKQWKLYLPLLLSYTSGQDSPDGRPSERFEYWLTPALWYRHQTRHQHRHYILGGLGYYHNAKTDYDSRGSLWGILWTWEEEGARDRTNDRFEKFEIFGGLLYQWVRHRGEEKQRFLGISL